MTSRISSLMKAARESLEEGQVEGVDVTIGDEEAEVALADTSLPTEIVEDVVEPVSELNAGLDDVEAIQADAERIAHHADVLEETLADDGAGADPVAAQLAGEDVAAAVERWALAAKQLPSRESFNSSAGRRASTESHVAMAREAVGEMAARAKEAIKKAWEWLKGILEQAFSKQARLIARAKALASSVKGNGGGKIEVGNVSVLGSLGAVEASAALKEVGADTKKLLAVKQGDSIELKQGGLGQGSMKLTTGEDGLMKFSAEANEGAGEQTINALSAADAAKVCANVISGLEFLGSAKEGANKVIRTNATGDDATVKQAMAFALAVGRAQGTLVGVGMRAASKLLEIVEKSAKAADPAQLPAPGAAAA